MKVILSRKAFDSGAGGVANPILDDGSMIPMPIPDKQSAVRYRDITVAGRNLGSIAADLTRGRTRTDHFAHLDPDLVHGAYRREAGWRPLFGQVGASQSVLAREGVGPGDLFLFFGWFRRVTQTSDGLRFVRGEPDMHVIWGWLQVDEVVPVDGRSLPQWMDYHPHVGSGSRGRNNTIYVARETLTLDGCSDSMPGAGVFSHYDERLRLTKPGSKRSIWTLPSWFAPSPPKPPLGFHAAPVRWLVVGENVELCSAARGQEFVLDASQYPQAGEWIGSLLEVARSGDARASGSGCSSEQRIRNLEGVDRPD